MFALLEHDPPGDEPRHWDLLIEAVGMKHLPTWRLAAHPAEAAGAVAAQRVFDHRRFYLDYEGDVAGGRGCVRRVDRGEAEFVRLTDQEAEFELHGALLRGRFVIEPDENGTLAFRRRV